MLILKQIYNWLLGQLWPSTFISEQKQPVKILRNNVSAKFIAVKADNR